VVKASGSLLLIVLALAFGSGWASTGQERAQAAGAALIGTQKLNVIPTDSRSGSPSLALIRSYSARTANRPSVICAPAP